MAPFPGMDPFLEGQLWRDFHHAAITAMREALVPRLVPRYVVEIHEIPVRPDLLRLPPTIRVAQGSLHIRKRGSMDVVTVIELLSPTNKSPRGGHQEYLAKRAALLETPASLVEIDLLRGGTRLPTVEPQPAGDYYAHVSRGGLRPQVEVYHWQLRDRLPPVPIPLAEGDPDVRLDLQDVLTTVYDRSGYRYLVDYGRDPEPPLAEADERWAREILRQAE